MAEERLNPLTWLQGKFEEKSNKVTSWSNPTTDTNYPSEKLVKDYVDAPKEYFEKKSFTKTLDLSKPLDELSNRTGNNRYGNLYDSLNGEWEITVDIGTLSDGQGFGIANSSYNDGLCFGINPLGNSSNHFQVLNLGDENELYNGFNLSDGTYGDGNDTSLAVPNSNFTLKISYHMDEPLYYQSDEKTIHIECYVNGSLNDSIIGYGDLGFCHFETYGDPSLSVQMKTEISYPKLYETPLPFEKINENYAIGEIYGESKIYDLMECDLTFNKNSDGIQLYSNEPLFIEYNNGYLYLKKYDDQQGSFNTIFTIKQGNTCKIITYRLSDKLVYILFEGYWITSDYYRVSYNAPPFMYTLINAGSSQNNYVNIGSSIDAKFYRPVIPTRTSELVNDSNFLTTHQSITEKEDKSNKVTSLSSSSTDTQYPSAKCVYDNIKDKLEEATQKTIILTEEQTKYDRLVNYITASGPSSATARTSDVHCGGTGSWGFVIDMEGIISNIASGPFTLKLTKSGVGTSQIKDSDNNTFVNIDDNEITIKAELINGRQFENIYVTDSNSENVLTWQGGYSTPLPSLTVMTYSSNQVGYFTITEETNYIQSIPAETTNINAIANIIYPVGSIYMSVNATSPETLFGGEWEQIKDTFLLAAGDTYANGSTGGSATVTLTSAQSGVPAHSHKYQDYNTTYTLKTTNRKPGTSTAVAYGTSLTAGGGATERTSSNNTAADASQAHENMPPYLSVYMWKRTA